LISISSNMDLLAPNRAERQTIHRRKFQMRCANPMSLA
jgi:hypothetical protein